MTSFAALAPMQDPWAIVLPAALGLAAVYLLVPRPRPVPYIWGLATGALALLLAGWWWMGGQIVLPEKILFYAFSAIALVSGGLLVTQRNPVRAALSFALVVLSTCGLFLLQAAPFLMAATIIIYAGAIIVTFIFVIMLAQQEGLSDADYRSREPFLSCVAGFVLLGALLFVLQATYQTRDFDDLLSRLATASQASSVQQVRSTLGEGFDEKFQGELARARVGVQQSAVLTTALNDVAINLRPEANIQRLRAALSRLQEQARVVRNGMGSLQPSAETPLSHFGELPTTAPGGRAPLPAENTAYLGRMLFSDYLVAVELGGTLLLVATIGAIAIAGRRPEGQA